MIRLLSLLILLLGLTGAGAQGLKAPADLVRASLIAEPAALRGGEPFTVALRLVMKPGWHVYWRNPGDSGLPPEVTWTLPAGFSAGPIQWPVPERIPVATLMNFGYADEAVLLVTMTPPPSLDPAEPARLAGQLTYLVCAQECVPGSAELRLTLPVAGAAAGADPANAALFARARAALPEPAPGPVRLASAGDRLVLSLDAPDLGAVRTASFFPYSETILDNAAPQDLAVDAQGLRLTLTRATPADPPPADLPGVLAIERETEAGPVRQAFALGQAPAVATGGIPAAAEPAPAKTPASTPDESLTLWGAAGLAFLGGLLLNLMPCVFPVLSIKVLSLVRHSGEGPGRVRLHGLAYTAGVLAAFIGLAGLLIALKSGGAGIGWGFQLQSPIVVAGLAYLLFGMGLSLSGVVHLGSGLAGLGDGLSRRAGLEGSFFTGMLATVVATPCTAPFMGAAVGFALTQSAAAALAIFASLGLGLALPFLLLTLFPGALRRLPRPGAWMETLKGVLAFPVYATVAWLVWVLSQQVGPAGLFSALIGLVLVGFAAWIWERGRQAPTLTGRLARGLAGAALVAVGGLTFTLDHDRAAGTVAQRAEGIEPFTQARLDALRAEGRPVFVNLTAAWCITCQVNERTALATEGVRAALKLRGVTYLKGDWTNQNPEITRLLERHGRSGVPLYLLYGAGPEPVVLPQILTQGTVLSALEPLAPVTDGRSAAAEAAANRD
ncbi:protein-disulfide reductase DsbD family protein [Methylobacterium soli]|uniref:Thiol:disulfide interchange protein n=1 Tax=Methylobacterium soli TaxID=553447 RepID=A0A6L3T138_9HYPH|nr:protein-disulfide reductase DsbD domain-containing protein [Methylobacterium soli]KAB1076812.1 thiol:disulfide interchange protein [Methylobacterium soli]GJE46153.1 Thiol:disulfide interchange protein DsbD [Methylobacterium soli]